MENLKNCSFCSSCYYCYYCYYRYCCYYSKNIRQSEYIIFGLGNNEYNDTDLGYHRKYYAFNKYVGGDRYSVIIKNVKSILNNLLFNENKSYSENWKQVTTEQWIALSEIPEFDKSVVEGIIGFKLNLAKETITIDGIVYDKGEVEAKLKDIKPVKQ